MARQAALLWSAGRLACARDGGRALSIWLAVGLCAYGALAQTDKTATSGQPCTVIQQVNARLTRFSLAPDSCEFEARVASVNSLPEGALDRFCPFRTIPEREPANLSR